MKIGYRARHLAVIGCAVIWTATVHAEALPPVPSSNPGEWVQQSDYPTDALMGGVEGVVGFVLEVDATGRASACEVTQSSGNVSLDEKACATLLKNARFTPASDADGEAVPGEYQASIRWQIIGDENYQWSVHPVRLEQPSSMVHEVRVVLDEGGEIADCEASLTGTGDLLELAVTRVFQTYACEAVLSTTDVSVYMLERDGETAPTEINLRFEAQYSYAFEEQSE